MRIALCVALLILLTACGQSAEPEVEETPPAPPLSEQLDSYSLSDITIQSAGAYTGYVAIDDQSVEIHPYYDLYECLTVRVMYTSGQDWWEAATADLPVADMGSYQLVQNADGSVIGFMPIDDEHGVFVATRDLSLGYVKLYMDKIWTSDT